jgi:DNA-binding NarL/FixJ family response regulator
MPDVVVLDISMPVMNGFQAAAQIQECCPTAGIIVATMHAGPQLMRQAVLTGAKAFLLKDENQLHLLASYNGKTLAGRARLGPLNPE